MTAYKYKLQEYTTAKESRHTCPGCGHKNEFAFYVDADNNPINELVGKCNRESKCGYHLTPSEWFKTHDISKTDFKPLRQKKEKPITYLSIDVLTSHAREENNLYRFLINHFEKEKVSHVLDMYKVGSSKHWKNGGGYASTFPQIDEQGRLRRIKVMAYSPVTGKRLKKYDQPLIWSSKQKTYFTDTYENDKIWWADKMINPNGNFKQTLFGCHLIPGATNIGIVESEKTALICSILLPEITWIATGGCNGCKWTEIDVYRPLIEKRVCLYPDSGEFSKWSEKAQILRMGGVKVSVSNMCEGLPANSDIADVLLGEVIINPIPETAESEKDVIAEIGENLIHDKDGVVTTEGTDDLHILNSIDGVSHNIVKNPNWSNDAMTACEIAAYMKDIGCTNGTVSI